MRPLCLAFLLFACAGCMVRMRVPQPPGLKVSVKAALRVDAAATVKPPVALQGAPVVEFFGIPLDDAQDVVFVLDRSGSMGASAQGALAQITDPNAAPPPAGDPNVPAPPPPVPTKIEVAHYELIEALKRLPAGTRLDVIFFNEDLAAYQPGLFALDDAGRAGVISFVSGAAAAGQTALVPAMRTAFLMNARRVVLLSDGLGNVGGDARALLRDAREAMLGGVRIDTIGLGTGQDARTLSTLARESGGIYQAL